jgi:hypothetical protein
METDGDFRCAPAGDGHVVGTAVLAEFGRWVDRERGLSAVSVRCYVKQAKAFLTAIGGPAAVRSLDAGTVTAFVMGHSRDRNTSSAKAMVTSLRSFLRFAHATGRTAVPLAGAVPAVASWRLAALLRGMATTEIERLLAGCDRTTVVGGRLISCSRSDPDPDASARPRSKMIKSVDRAAAFLGAATPGTLRRSPVRGGRRTGSYDE